jgi:hypothetical protein
VFSVCPLKSSIGDYKPDAKSPPSTEKAKKKS